MQHMYEVLARHIGGISSYDLGHTHYCTAYVRSLSVVRKRFNEVSLSRAMTALFVGKIISFLDEPPRAAQHAAPSWRFYLYAAGRRTTRRAR